MEKRIKKFLLEYCQIPGTPHSERAILDKLENEFKEFGLKYERMNKFGIVVIKGNPLTAKKITVFDSHVDCVQKNHIEPSYDPQTKVFTATGLDNRIGVSINHMLARFLSPSNVECYLFLFSTKEELDGSGVKNFVQSRTRAERKKWLKWCEIDVCYAKDVNGFFKDTTFSYRDPSDVYKLSEILWLDKLPTIGRGFCPIVRGYKTQDWGYKSIPKNNTNTRQLRKAMPDFKNIQYYAVPVLDMHYKISKAHMYDISLLLRYLI